MRAALVGGSLGIVALLFAAQVAVRVPHSLVYELVLWTTMAAGGLVTVRFGWLGRRAALVSLGAPVVLELLLLVAFATLPPALTHLTHAVARVVGMALAALVITKGARTTRGA